MTLSPCKLENGGTGVATDHWGRGAWKADRQLAIPMVFGVRQSEVPTPPLHGSETLGKSLSLPGYTGNENGTHLPGWLRGLVCVSGFTLGTQVLLLRAWHLWLRPGPQVPLQRTHRALSSHQVPPNSPVGPAVGEHLPAGTAAGSYLPDISASVGFHQTNTMQNQRKV